VRCVWGDHPDPLKNSKLEKIMEYVITKLLEFGTVGLVGGIVFFGIVVGSLMGYIVDKVGAAVDQHLEGPLENRGANMEKMRKRYIRRGIISRRVANGCGPRFDRNGRIAGLTYTLNSGETVSVPLMRGYRFDP